MKKGLVSVITPCFNTGDYLHWLLDSVLEQTYPYIQMIVVDDGSTDNSRQIIESYVPKFNDRGYSLEYVYQEIRAVGCNTNRAGLCKGGVSCVA